ncbi:PDDEXK family nuclease [Limnoglobus roseus]|uniref:Uma2 family endonuclease n=1 Tax=Limnoglobus roseus TaxID=2598579 RepID=A0A5C1A9Y7_9BACT|nr:Uma2 family endonuclease [Limnoglobus roseus]QEL15385.1 Uma2 family endonuclease [Limnoglobus roseus]
MSAKLALSLDDMIASPPVGSPLVLFRWTVEQYSELNKLDIFHAARSVLVHGEIYPRPRRTPQHEYVIGKVHDWLWKTFRGDGHHARSQTGLVIDEFSRLAPDVSVVEGLLER